MSGFDIYPASALSGIESLRPALETSIRNPITDVIIADEVEEVLAAVALAQQGRGDRYYAVATASGGRTLGLMGLTAPDATMRAQALSDNPAELVNAYVLSSERGTGIGKALVGHLETTAAALGHTEIIVNSGPRYMLSGWPFWRRIYGEPATVLKDYYGPTFDAVVWRKILVKS